MTLVSWSLARFGVSRKGSAVFRRKRFRVFLDLIDEVLGSSSSCRILDIGGEPEYWSMVADLIGDRKIHVTLVNLTAPDVDSDLFSSMAGDARNLGALPDMSFDIVHSNSVIEHVGRWQDMLDMAREVRRLAPAYFVQTPYFWFPIEPHCSTAFFHWLPRPIRLAMLLRKARGPWQVAPDVTYAMGLIESAELLDVRSMAALFPDAAIRHERVAGLTKSLIAIRRPGDLATHGRQIDESAAEFREATGPVLQLAARTPHAVTASPDDSTAAPHEAAVAECQQF